MIFGSKPVYKYAVYNKRKMHTMGKAYAFTEAPVEISECAIKLVNDKAEIFYEGAIFNTYVLSIEDNVCIVKTVNDDKLTFTKDKLKENVLYTVKVIAEDEKTREVVLYQNDELFPGHKSKGKLSLINGKLIFTSKFGKGPILLQSNEVKGEVEAMVSHLDCNGPMFVEINNPVERCTVTVIKDLNNMKIVENENIKGILIGNKDKKVNDEVNVYTKNVYPGSYCFVEDINEGYAEVQLVEKQGDCYRVKYKDFFGTCKDKKVSKVMKGIISNIKGNSFEFKQCKEDELERTKDFEPVAIAKKVKVLEECDIKGDQMNAIEYIRKKIETMEAMKNSSNEKQTCKVEDEDNEAMNTDTVVKKSSNIENESKDKVQQKKITNSKGSEVVTVDVIRKLFNKYIATIKEHDLLSLFYLKYMSDNNNLTQKLVDKLIKEATKDFPTLASSKIEDINLCKMIFKQSKNLIGFKKLLEVEEDKTRFIKENMEFFKYSIDFIYEHMTSPRVTVENVIDENPKNWVLYVNKESGNYKRNLFRRIVKMSFKKQPMKEIFKLWLSYEESIGGNVEEVHMAEQAFAKK